MVGSRQNSARFQIIISWNSKSFMKMEAGFSQNLLACRCQRHLLIANSSRTKIEPNWFRDGADYILIDSSAICWNKSVTKNVFSDGISYI